MKSLRDVDISFLDHPPEALQVGAIIERSAEDVFDIVADEKQLRAYLKDFVSAEAFPGAPEGVGFRREVKLKMLTVNERFVAWDRGKRLSFVMEGITLPIVRAMGEDIHFDTLGERRCRVRWRVGYEPSALMRPVHAVAKAVFGDLFQSSVTMLKTYAEGRG